MVELGMLLTKWRNRATDIQGAWVITVVTEHLHVAVLDSDDNELEFEAGLREALCAVQGGTDGDDDWLDVPRERPDTELR